MPTPSIAAFELVFGRKPRPGEDAALADLTAKLANHASHEMLADLLEQRRQHTAPEHATLMALSRSDRTRELWQGQHVDWERFEAAYDAILDEPGSLIIGQRDYLPQHQSRFRELFNTCGKLLEGRPEAVVLEFGASEFSALYKQLFPGVSLHISDRPTAAGYIGFTEAVARGRLGCDAYYALDLEQPSSLLASSGITPGTYDLVVFAEVLEHLVVNPTELIEQLLQLLKPDGFLYLTTPNLFRHENRERWLALENPQAVFPGQEANWDRHHHHREYGAIELARFINAAGGHIAAFYYSSCWDLREGLAEDERGNLVFVIALPNGLQHGGPSIDDSH
ncbi:MAG: methyltransferase domain-containing protein [Gammaproteobacteria bacterium]|jgi:SAM-dependent methyltransferase|nr:methyltransferase domain-containing protein [Gammaproteobacteria bacterium]